MTMRLLCKIGRYAGLVMEYPDHIGENLLDTGMAERPPEGSQLAPMVEEAVAPSPETPEWPLKMEPGDYLKRHPEGQHADLAKELAEP